MCPSSRPDTYEDDTEVLAIGRAARERGHYESNEFVAVCRWKTPRSGPLVASNTAEAVETATRIALNDGSDERERMRALRALRGVDWPTASVLLHLAYAGRWAILDKRALHALGVRLPVTYSFRFWVEYVEAWRELRQNAGVDSRVLDRSLWQWSSEPGLPLY